MWCGREKKVIGGGGVIYICLYIYVCVGVYI